MRFVWLLLSIVSVVVGCQRGKQGVQGVAGSPGISGSSCSVSQQLNGSVITCEDGTSAVVLNGVHGSDAPVGAYSVVDVVKPCPGPGHREVLLRLGNGQLMAHYSDGAKQFLTFLAPGNYRLTDGSNCNFTVHSDLTVSW